MNNDIIGQLTIFDVVTDEKKIRPCDYRFKRYIGQRVHICITKGVFKGTIEKIEPYYTHIMTDDGELLAGSPYNVTPMEGHE